ncbi:MAG: Gfo/Idh/MocA family oxidoreductase [Anaerolineae bacterium]|nr:Gfo/Idh/MocA family oxidoreductase [Anaerolineae bacterium]
MDTVRWGIIGCGNVTEVKSGPALQQTGHSELVAVMRRDGEKARDYAARHGVPKWYDDADALIHDPDVNAVYIATPPDSHAEYTRRVAAAGKPVYVEKPLARTHAECQQMITACESAGVSLYAAYYRRCLPRFLKIRDLIEGGAIGAVRLVSITYTRRPLADLDPADLPWRVRPEIAGGGLFVDLASHMLDFLDYALGPIARARGFAVNQGGRYPAEDSVSGSFDFASGALGSGSWCFTAYEDRDRTEITGTAGCITYATFDESPVELTNAEGTQRYAIANPPHIQGPLIQTVVDDLRGVGQCPSTGASAARTSWVMDQLLADYYGPDGPA